MSPYAMALSPGFLTFVRKATGLTQKEFAESIGVSHSTIGCYETGERRMSEETWSKIKAVHREILDNLDVPDTLVTESELCIRPEHIRRIRILAGLSQREFAESIGVCKSTIGNVEIGRNVSEDLRMKVKERFPIQYRQVMFGESPINSDQSLCSDQPVADAGLDYQAVTSDAEPEKVSIIIQSPDGKEITPGEIVSRIGVADTIYVRVDHNAAYWVRGIESGKTELWA